MVAMVTTAAFRYGLPALHLYLLHPLSSNQHPPVSRYLAQIWVILANRVRLA